MRPCNADSVRKGGAVGSTLTSLHPFARYEFNERTSVWGVAGYGTGGLRLTPDGTETALDAGLATRMAAFGGRGVVSRRGGGFELAALSDAVLNADFVGRHPLRLHEVPLRHAH